MYSFVILVAVVIAFFVCWAPYQAQRLLFVWVTQYGDWTATLRDVNQALFYIAGKCEAIIFLGKKNGILAMKCTNG